MHVVPIKHPNTNTRDVMMSPSHGTIIPQWQVQGTLCITCVSFVQKKSKIVGKSALGIYLTIFEVWRVQCLSCQCAFFVCLLHFLLSHFLTQILSHLKLAGTFAISQTLWLGSLLPFCSIRHFRSNTSLRFALLQLKRCTFFGQRTCRFKPSPVTSRIFCQCSTAKLMIQF